MPTDSHTPPSTHAQSATNVLLIGGGGREHALAAQLARSPTLGTLYTTHPSNPGIAALATPVDVPVSKREIDRLVRFCDARDIALVVVGPEEPLAQGFADRLTSPARVVLGPTAAGARLEADKAWAKELMRAASIPTAEARIFDHYEAARAYIESRTEPPVLKASGLAAGKGVFVPATPDEALAALDELMLKDRFGDAARQVLVEERLAGPEVSVLALVDGRTIAILPTCRDHKRLGDGDTGPNTGGMGAYSPTTLIDDATMSRIEHEILVPIVDTLRREGITYRGVLYAGLMLTHAGPKVLEFNVRFGDPECQPLMARFQGDLVDVLRRTASGTLADADVSWDPRPACCVVLASEGYPQSPRVGLPIAGLDEARALEHTTISLAGVRRLDDGSLVTAGGRVLGVTALGDTLDEARDRAYAACELISFPGKTLRHDIAAARDNTPSHDAQPAR